MQICWERSLQGWIRLKTDGASSGNPGLAGCGGLLRNESCECIKGFSRNIGRATNFTAELWGLRDGLTLCKDLNLCAINIQIDAKAIIELLANPLCSNIVVTPIVDDCKRLLSQIPQVKLGHCYREANGCADFLAKKGISQDGDFFCLC